MGIYSGFELKTWTRQWIQTGRISLRVLRVLYNTDTKIFKVLKASNPHILESGKIVRPTKLAIIIYFENISIGLDKKLLPFKVNLYLSGKS